MGTKSKWLKGKLTFYNNAVVEENVSTAYVTAADLIPPYGLRVLQPAGAVSFIVNGGPTVGAELQIVNVTTHIATVRVSTAAADVEIHSNGAQSTNFYGVTLKAASAAKGEMPGCVSLRGLSTARWVVVGTALSSGGTTGGGHALSTSLT